MAEPLNLEAATLEICLAQLAAGGGVELWYYPIGDEHAKAKTYQAACERQSAGRTIWLCARPMAAECHAYGVERIEPGEAGRNAVISILAQLSNPEESQ